MMCALFSWVLLTWVIIICEVVVVCLIVCFSGCGASLKVGNKGGRAPTKKGTSCF